MKKILALVLAAVMMLTLCACSDPAEKLYGTWEMVSYVGEDTTVTTLENFDFYPEEIALLEDPNFGIITFVEFREDGTYRFSYNLEKTKEHIHGFYVDFIGTLYENRALLVESYGDEIVTMSEAEFNQFYAELFGMTDYESLITAFVDETLDYDVLSGDYERGTYSVVLDKIMCTIEGETEAESMAYELEGDVLTLTYVDGEEVYTKIG